MNRAYHKCRPDSLAIYLPRLPGISHRDSTRFVMGLMTSSLEIARGSFNKDTALGTGIWDRAPSQRVRDHSATIHVDYSTS